MYSKIQENICRFRYLVIHYVWFCRFLVKSSLELMLYCFIMCRIKIKFSYLILSYTVSRLSYYKPKYIAYAMPIL